jgi:RNA-directed DNA polymerase
VLKLDIQGYFMAMNKPLLYDKIFGTLLSFSHTIDFNLPLTVNLINKTLFNDPRINCGIKGRNSDWDDLPASKTLFQAGENCGLPIGNLTSQLFGNIYLNDFDHFVKRDLDIRYYGRYVDDFILMHHDKEYLKTLVPHIADYLQTKLRLTLHPHKIYLQPIENGVQYLGAVIKPYRKYIAKRTTGNFYAAIAKHNLIAQNHKPTVAEKRAFFTCTNSYLGILQHYKTYKLRKSFLLNQVSAWWWNYFYIAGFAKLVFK